MKDIATLHSEIDRSQTKGEEHMTNYDRWKLATPDYLEDTDGKEEALHGDFIVVEDCEEPSSGGKSDTAHGERRAG
jgi:hypothetical protein